MGRKGREPSASQKQLMANTIGQFCARDSPCRTTVNSLQLLTITLFDTWPQDDASVVSYWHCGGDVNVPDNWGGELATEAMKKANALR